MPKKSIRSGDIVHHNFYKFRAEVIASSGGWLLVRPMRCQKNYRMSRGWFSLKSTSERVGQIRQAVARAIQLATAPTKPSLWQRIKSFFQRVKNFFKK